MDFICEEASGGLVVPLAADFGSLVAVSATLFAQETLEGLLDGLNFSFVGAIAFASADVDAAETVCEIIAVYIGWSVNGAYGQQEDMERTEMRIGQDVKGSLVLVIDFTARLPGPVSRQTAELVLWLSGSRGLEAREGAEEVKLLAGQHGEGLAYACGVERDLQM